MKPTRPHSAIPILIGIVTPSAALAHEGHGELEGSAHELLHLLTDALPIIAAGAVIVVLSSFAIRHWKRSHRDD